MCRIYLMPQQSNLFPLLMNFLYIITLDTNESKGYVLNPFFQSRVFESFDAIVSIPPQRLLFEWIFFFKKKERNGYTCLIDTWTLHNSWGISKRIHLKFFNFFLLKMSPFLFYLVDSVLHWIQVADQVNEVSSMKKSLVPWLDWTWKEEKGDVDPL